jgi:hypothetical protein
VEVLKEFRKILLGQELIVHTDHENLTYKKFNSDHVMRWQLFIEEYSPNLCYIKGEKNIVANALSQLELLCEPMEEAHFTEELCSSLYAKEEITPSDYPLFYAALGAGQAKDKQILKILQKKSSPYVLKSFHGVGTSRELICYKDKMVVVPASQQVQIIDWYQLPWSSWNQQDSRNHWSTPLVAKHEKAHNALSVLMQKLSMKQMQP